MPKYLDMPEGNGRCSIYDSFEREIDKGNAVAIIRVLDTQGDYAWFISAGEPIETLTADNSIQHAFAMVLRARIKAESLGHHPLEVHPSDVA